MAVAIKAFNGTASGSTTIYTVPGGRCAKIIFSFLKLSIGTGDPVDFTVGNYTFTYQPGTGSGGTAYYVPNTSTLLPNVATSPGYYNFEYYLPPGETVSQGTNGSATYAFVAIEEVQS